MMPAFRGVYLQQGGERQTLAEVRSIDRGDVPDQPNGVTVDVAYSTINYKDALAITGRAPVVRRFPMIPGIDLAGTVAVSQSGEWAAGEEVLVNGWEIGERHWGGLAQVAVLRPEWLLRRPPGLSLYDTMALGTAGYTAALAVLALERHGLRPGGDILVTGATGGVGSIAILLLARAGYRVTASTGKLAEADYLRGLGATDVFDRRSLEEPGKPLQKERWDGAVDAVGSHTLANVCAQTCYGGAVAACGLAQGMDLPATVAPFILRGVALLGINSVITPVPLRQAAWRRLEGALDAAALRALSHEIPLDEAIPAASTLLAGGITGRLVVNVNS